MFQNAGNYQFRDVTDVLDPGFDRSAEECDYVPQVRDIDGSGINSYLSGALSYNVAKPAGNYIIVNDGSGNLHTALHGTLNVYGQQIINWLNAHHPPQWYVTAASEQPKLRAYQTPNGKLNFLAVVDASAINSKFTHEFILVNVPLQLDVTTQFTQPMTVENRNGSHLIRTFAGDDTVYSGNNGGYSKIDGGLGTNTVVYSGPSQNYSAVRNADGTWTITDNVGGDGTDTLTRIQRLQFTDAIVTVDTSTDLAVKPTISAVVNGASFQPGVVAGSWATIEGRNLSGVTRIWRSSDFVHGDVLPTNLSGVQVTFNGVPAAVYYISPTQLNVQVPANLNGPVSVQASYFGTSNSYQSNINQNAPGLFAYQAGPESYPAAVYNGTSTLVGDPAVSGPSVRKARGGDIILVYCTGLEPSPAGSTLQTPIPVQSPVAVRFGSQSATVLGAALVYPGEFQINVVVPALLTGDYPLTITVGDQSSQPGVTVPIE